jgi:hypothetical protein
MNRAIPVSHFEHKGRIEPLDWLVRVAALATDDLGVSGPVIGEGRARQRWFLEPLHRKNERLSRQPEGRFRAVLAVPAVFEILL